MISHRFLMRAAPLALSLSIATPALAQEADADASPIKVTGTVALTSDYRFRGVSQSDKEMAVQGGITITHDSGVYIGTWGSNLSGWGTFGGANMELDLIAGYRHAITDNATIDAGLVWYMYPGGADKTDFAELYGKLSGIVGPATLTAGVAYSPKQQALGRYYNSGASAQTGVFDNPGDKEDNLYLSGDGAFAIAGTPLTAKAHIGWTDGNPGLGPNGTSLAPTGKYWDWSLGADATWRNLTLGVAYVDTDIGNAEAAYLQPNFSKGQDGTGAIADGAVVVSLTAAF